MRCVYMQMGPVSKSREQKNTISTYGFRSLCVRRAFAAVYFIIYNVYIVANEY